MPRSYFMIEAPEYLAQRDRSRHRAAGEHRRQRPDGAAPTATGSSRAWRASCLPVLMIAIALLVTALVGPIAARADPSAQSAPQRHASVTSIARAGDPAAAPSGHDWWLVALIGSGAVAAVAVTSRRGRSSAVPRLDSAVAGAPLLAAARLLRDPKIRIESPLDDLAYLVLDQPPHDKPYPTRAYWAALTTLDRHDSRPS